MEIVKPPAPLITIHELAELLKVPVKTIYYWVNRREIPFLKVGKHLRFDPEEVLAAFRKKTSKPKTCLNAKELFNLFHSHRSLKISKEELARPSTKGDG